MKLSEKFFDDLDKIGQDAFIEKNMWIGKLVPEIIVDNLKKRGITPDDLEGVVCLTVEEAKAVLECVDACAFPSPFEGFVSENILLRDKLKKQIEQMEKCDE